MLATCIALIGGVCNAKASPPEPVRIDKVEVNQYQEVTFNYTVIDCQSRFLPPAHNWWFFYAHNAIMFANIVPINIFYTSFISILY